MGHKGVSKRKPKQTTPHSNSNEAKNSGRSAVQILLNDKSAPLESDKAQKKKKH